MRVARWRNWSWAGLGGLGTVLVLIATSRYGSGYNPDAVTALATARNLLGGEGLFSHFALYVRWPPLFPFLQAVFGAFGIAPMEAARWLNALSYGVLVAGMGKLIARTTRSRSGRVLGIGSALFAFPLFRQSVEASTEPLFAVLVLLFVLQGGQYLGQPKRKHVALLSGITALACLQRYAGVALLACGGILLLFRESIIHLRWLAPSFEAWKRAVVFGVGASTPLGVWLFRNVVESGTLTGPRSAPEHTLGDSLRALVDAATSWLIPVPLPVLIRVGITVAVVSALVYGAVHYTAKNREPGGRQEWARTCWIVLGVYLLMIVVTGAVGASELPSRRLLMPVFAPALLLGVWGLDAVYSGLISSGRIWSHVGVILGHTGWVLGMALLTLMYAWVRVDIGGGGYNTEAWQTSETAEWVRQHRPDKPVRSNKEHALYFLTSVPQREPESGAIPQRMAPSFRQYPADGYYIACFDHPERARLSPKILIRKLAILVPPVSRLVNSVPDLPNRDSKVNNCSSLVAPTAEVDTLRRFRDGAIYEVRSALKKAP